MAGPVLNILANSIWGITPEQLNTPAIRWPLTGLYILVLILISIYGLHRYALVYLYYKNRRKQPRVKERFTTLPRVTVQLPMFNEMYVAERIIDATVNLDYPRDRLQVQVVDDSTDGSADIARARVEYWADQGVDIQYIHRTDRSGFKAGALAAAMPAVTGEFIAIFDADFVPPAEFLKRTIHHFTDASVGMVQTCWGHLNRNDSVLTRTQAVFLDAHFLIEHAARCQSERWINFNGTAGIWRREAIETAGGWHSDTLTEDVDLSYRSQLAGWRFVFLPRVICPAELPPEMNAFKAQQHRWTKGSIQVAKKLLPTLLKAKAPFRVKLEAFFHLTSMMVYLYITMMVLLFFPAFYVNMQPFEDGTIAALVWAMSLFAMGTASAGSFYVASQHVQKRSLLKTILLLPMLMSIGVGIAINNARAVIEALIGHDSPFVRTPKYNTDKPKAETKTKRRKVIPTPSIKLWMSVIEIAMGSYTLVCAKLAFDGERTVYSVPFLIMFAIGYLYVGFSSLSGQWRGSRTSGELSPLPG